MSHPPPPHGGSGGMRTDSSMDFDMHHAPGNSASHQFPPMTVSQQLGRESNNTIKMSKIIACEIKVSYKNAQGPLPASAQGEHVQIGSDSSRTCRGP